MSFVSTVGGWLRSLGGSISGLFSTVVRHETDVFEAFFQIEDDVKAAADQLRGFGHFEFDPKWKTRVINVPSAVDGINELIDIIFHQLRDKFDEIKDGVGTIKTAWEGQPITEGEGPSQVGNIASKWATMSIVLGQFKDTVHNVLQLEQMLLDVKQRLETLDDLFLPQGKPKITGDFHYRKRQG